jgi:UDP-GlcNAc:undecaprenyl-phosphate/decaprenyl-phosphate GlcNAc-1-phosphate transferase
MEVSVLSVYVLLAFLTSAAITVYDIPIIISLALKKNLVDVPDGRKLHKKPVPALGGIAIFVGSFISYSVWAGSSIPVFYPFLIAGSVLLLTVGIKDDIFAMDPGKKLIAQIMAASTVVIGGKVRLYIVDGLFGFHTMPELVAITATILAFVIIINAYNLIDGVDGLAGTLSMIGTLIFGIWFFVNGHVAEALLSASLAGALLGFLYYNITPAKIFMGDTGSLIVGMLMGVMAFRLIELNAASTAYSFQSPTIFALTLLIIPLFDLLRVFVVRILNGKAPFYPDRNHIHHKLLAMGFGHRNICRFLCVSYLGIIIFSLSLFNLNIHIHLFFILAVTFLIIPTARVLKQWQAKIRLNLRERHIQKSDKPLQKIRIKSDRNEIYRNEADRIFGERIRTGKIEKGSLFYSKVSESEEEKTKIL